MSASVLGTSNYVRRNTPYLELETKGGEESGGGYVSKGVNPACASPHIGKQKKLDNTPACIRIRFRKLDKYTDID